MKCCFKCGAEKPLSEFYKHSRMPDGHVNKCKECNKADNNANRLLKSDYYKEYDRNRSSNPDRVMGRAKYAASEAGKASRILACKRYKESNPKKRAVHIKTGNAIRDGYLSKKAL